MILKNRRRASIAGIVFMAALVIIGSSPAAAEIRFGALPRLSPAELQDMYSPLAEYLGKETGEKVTIVVPKDFEAFKAAVKAGRVDIAFANPLIYVQVKEKSNIEPLALSSEVKSGTRFRGIIIVRKDSGFSTLQDLKGKKFIFVDKDISLLPFAKKHDNVTAAVFNKTVDAGGIREDEMDKAKDKLDISQLRIVAVTDYFPNWPLFATAKLNPGLAAKIKAALLKLKPNDPQNEKILGPARLTGFVPVSDKDYDDLRKAAKIAGAL